MIDSPHMKNKITTKITEKNYTVSQNI